MRRRIYLVLLLLLVAVTAAGLYLRQRAVRPGSQANCDTPAPAPPPTAPPPKLPGFAVEAACGAGTEAPKAPVKKK